MSSVWLGASKHNDNTMDSRFYLKGEFHIYGKTYPFDMSLNWHTPGDGEIDRRITEFFLDSHDEAFRLWDRRNEAARAKREAEETERREKAELQRLRDKYGDA